MTQITAYGATGPKSDWMAHNLNAVAAGGWLYMSPGYSKSFELPPLKAFGQQGDFQGGLHGAVATMGALFARRAQARRDSWWTFRSRRRLRRRWNWRSSSGLTAKKWPIDAARLGPSAPYGILRCKDGLLHFLILEEAHWQIWSR